MKYKQILDSRWSFISDDQRLNLYFNHILNTNVKHIMGEKNVVNSFTKQIGTGQSILL